MFENKLNENVDNLDYCLFYVGKSYFILENFKKTIDVLSKLESKIDREDEISFMLIHYMNSEFELSKAIFKELYITH